jgi:competence protein ComEC
MSAADRGSRGSAAVNIHPSAWIAVPTLALLVGQAAATLPWNLPPSTSVILLAPAAGIVWRHWRAWAILCCLSALALTIGNVRHRQLLDPVFPENHLRAVMARGATLYLEGTLRQEPERLPQRSRWQFSAERIWHATGAEEIAGNILISLRIVRREWRYGDRVRLRLRPQVPQDSGNPGGFNYATYLARREIYATAFLEHDQDIELVEREAGRARGLIEDLRRKIRRFIDRSFAPDSGALLNALVVGDMGGISRETRDAFTAAGVNHVLSISGLHVAMLGLVAFFVVRYGFSWSNTMLLRWNLLKVGAFFSFLAVVFYTALAGAMVPTVRSALMIGVYQLAVLLDREEEVFASLTFAALLIALVWPGVIADISFQLSFLAVLFIVWGTRRMHEWFPRAKTDELPQERSWIKEKTWRASLHLAVPFLATLGTGPLVAHYFGHLSLAGFIANPVIVPLVGFLVVPLGLAIGFLAVIFPEAAPPLVWVVDGLATLTLSLVELFARLPLANIGVPAPNPVEVTLLYGFIICLFVLRRRWQLGLAIAVGLAVAGVDSVYWWRERHWRNDLRITHLNVGQGDAAVVELPRGRVLLIDAGGAATGDFDTGESIVAPFLRSRKIVKVDYLMVSHARIDHYGGMRALVREFAPSEFWSGAAKGKTQRFEDLEEELTRGKILRAWLSADAPCRVFEQVSLCTLYPPADGAEEASVVLRLDYGKSRFLFPGDIDKRDEAILARHGDELQSAVVKVPRHGSATASSNEFISGVQPKLAILSAGARSRAETQREEVTERYRAAGAEVLRTYEDGAVIVESDGKTLRYSGYKSGKKGKLTL